MKKWPGVLGIGLGESLIAVNFSIVSTSLATIQQEFHTSFLELQWMLNIFGIFLCSSLVIMGRLADTYGRRRIFLIGLIGSGLSSLIAGFAQHASWIIVAQMLQGLFGAILLGVSQALMVHQFSEKEHARAIGIWASIAGIMLGIGPLLAGSIISFIGWRWIFFINVPIAILAVIFVLRFVAESKSARKQKLDLPGMALLILTIGSFVLGVMQGPHWGWLSWESLLCAVVFAVSLPVLIYVESKSSFPIIHPEYFLKRDFLLPSLSNFCLIFYVWTVFFFFPLYFQKAQGASPLTTGLLMLLVTGPVALLAPKIGKWQGKIGTKPLLLGGFCVLLFSLILQFFFTQQSPLVLSMAASLTFGISWVLIWSPSTTAAISSLPRDQAGIASGAFTTIQEVGATIGLTITGTVFRSSPHPFMDGFRNSLWVLLAVVLLGAISSMAIKRSSR